VFLDAEPPVSREHSH